MLVITGNNVNDVYHEGLWKMKAMGVDQTSRNGAVKRILGPVATVYKNPTERMLFDAKRDANPFFHIFEGIWMLAGREDVQWLSQFNSNIAKYSDNGYTFHGAYGHRWRNHWGMDQIDWAVTHLTNNPNSRQCVVQMFDPHQDQFQEGDDVSLDIPCNTAIYFEIVNGRLNMTVTNRSNDMIWGAYGANAVHMSMLQEFMAGALGVGVGQYVQFSNNFHMYEQHFELLNVPAEEPTPYPAAWKHVPLSRSLNWQDDLDSLEEWCEFPKDDGYNPYVDAVLNPMLVAWDEYKAKDYAAAMAAIHQVKDDAVKRACEWWLSRRNWK